MLIKLVIFLPLIGALVSGVLSNVVSKKFAQIFNSALLVLSAIFAIIIFIKVGVAGGQETVILFDWITSGSFTASWTLYVDSLTAAMLVLVTFVSALVHIYSIGYMDEDPHVQRFMAYLSLFTFFMLTLITANNFLQLFVGWEGVGLASYLLIGFWFKKPSANAAAMKAFIVNRVGDFGLIIAIALIYLTFGTINFAEVFAKVPEVVGNKFTLLGMEFGTIDAIAILLFVGAMGKSAQIFLHTWLADAMEGPTPVSALIHAATMVTAGIFLVARCSPIFEFSPTALGMVAIVGATTALFAATIALTQNDIKKIIAYSTCSQLGYMFFACGVSAYSAGIFHLLTHGFFKALLFLGAGSVIHAMHHEQDIRNMGGLAKKIPFTCAMMWIGSLALAGFPPFAGYFSKDAILEAAYMTHTTVGQISFYFGITAAFLTAFYSWRLIFLVFNGKSRADHHTYDHAHESPLSMTIPLALLALGAIFSGVIGDKVLHMISFEGNFFANAIFVQADNKILEEIHHTPAFIKALPMILGVIAIALAYVFYIVKPSIPAKIAAAVPPLYKLSLNKWYFDEIYNFVFVNGIKKLGTKLWQFVDVKIIDGIPNGFASLCRISANQSGKIQTGHIYHYLIAMAIGIVGSLFYLITQTVGCINP